MKNTEHGSVSQRYLDSLPKEPCLNCMTMFPGWVLVPLEKGSDLKVCTPCNLTMNDKRVKEVLKLARKRQ